MHFMPNILGWQRFEIIIITSSWLTWLLILCHNYYESKEKKKKKKNLMHDSLLTKRNQWGLKVCVRWNVDTGFTLFTWQCVLWALLNGVCSSRYIFFMFFWAPKVSSWSIMFIPYERPSNLHFNVIYCTNPALQEENFHLKTLYIL